MRIKKDSVALFSPQLVFDFTDDCRDNEQELRPQKMKLNTGFWGKCIWEWKIKNDWITSHRLRSIGILLKYFSCFDLSVITCILNWLASQSSAAINRRLSRFEVTQGRRCFINKAHKSKPTFHNSIKEPINSHSNKSAAFISIIIIGAREIPKTNDFECEIDEK